MTAISERRQILEIRETMKRITGAIFLVGVICSADAVANGKTVADLADYCARPVSSDLKSHCYSYIDGFADALFIDRRPDKSICIPQQANAKQMALVFLRWAERNPQLHHVPGADGLFLSLFEAFPCRR